MRRTEISQKKSKLVIESIHTMNTFSPQMNEWKRSASESDGTELLISSCIALVQLLGTRLKLLEYESVWYWIVFIQVHGINIAGISTAREQLVFSGTNFVSVKSYWYPGAQSWWKIVEVFSLASALVSPSHARCSITGTGIGIQQRRLAKLYLWGISIIGWGIQLHSIIGWGIQLHGISIGIAQPRPNGCDIAQEGISSAPAFS